MSILPWAIKSGGENIQSKREQKLKSSVCQEKTKKQKQIFL